MNSATEVRTSAPRACFESLSSSCCDIGRPKLVATIGRGRAVWRTWSSIGPSQTRCFEDRHRARMHVQIAALEIEKATIQSRVAMVVSGHRGDHARAEPTRQAVETGTTGMSGWASLRLGSRRGPWQKPPKSQPCM